MDNKDIPNILRTYLYQMPLAVWDMSLRNWILPIMACKIYTIDGMTMMPATPNIRHEYTIRGKDTAAKAMYKII